MVDFEDDILNDDMNSRIKWNMALLFNELVNSSV